MADSLDQPAPSTPTNSARPRARSGRAPPRRGTAGRRCSPAGSARRPRRCSTWPAFAPARACSTSPRARASRRSRPRAARGHRLACSPPTSRPRSSTTPQGRREAPGSRNVETQELDGERHDALPEASFDAAISRVGLIYFPDQQRALRGIRHALAPGRALRRDRLLDARPQRVLRHPGRHHPPPRNLPPPLPGQPGPFSLGADGVLAQTLEQRASATSRCAASTHPCACRAPPNACASSASRSARCTR